MLGLIRRHQPKNPVLAIVYWVVFAAVTLTVILIGYYWLDKVVPQGGY